MDTNTILDKIDYLTLSLESFNRKSILLEEKLEELIIKVEKQDKQILELKTLILKNDEKTNHSVSNGKTLSLDNTTTTLNSSTHSSTKTDTNTNTSTNTKTTISTVTSTTGTETNTIPTTQINTSTINQINTTNTPSSSNNSTPNIESNQSSPIVTSTNSNTITNNIVPIPPPLPPVVSVQSSQSLWNKARVGIGLNRAFSTNNFFQKTDSEGNVSPIIGGLTKEDLFYIPPTSPKPPKNINIKNVIDTSSDNNTLSPRGNNTTPPNISLSSSTSIPNALQTLPAGSKWAIVWEYNAADDEWTRGIIAVEMESKPFSKGALRNAYKLSIKTAPVDQYSQFTREEHKKFEDGKIINTTNLPSLFGPVDSLYVAKDSISKSSYDRYFDDVKMQMICREYGMRYNSNSPPKDIEFLAAWVIEVQSSEGNSNLYGMELFMKGEFKKQNSNYGSVFSDRNTPQAFSHFTYECSVHELLIVDIQGVDDIYTDPQIHTKDGKGFGEGNLGTKGIERFINSHKCNPICIQYGLPPIGLTLNDSKQASRVIRGTMLLPDLIPDLEHIEPPPLPIPSNPLNSELLNLQTLTGHNERICSLLYKKGRLFSSDASGNVNIWDTNSLTLIESLRAHRKSVDSICLTDKYLITASSDKTIKIWQLLTDLEQPPNSTSKTPVIGANDCKFKLEDHSGEINDIAVDKKKSLLYSCSFDKSIKVWDLNSMKCIKTLNAHSKSVKSLCLSGQYLFSGSNDASIKVWDLSINNGMCIFGISDSHEAWVTSLMVHNGKLFSGSRDGEVKEWNLATFQPINKFENNTDNITKLLLAAKGYIFISSDDSTIKILDLSTMKIIYSMKAHRSGVGALATDGTKIFSGGNDNTIKIWNWVDKKE